MAKEVGNSTSKLHYIKPRIEKWVSAHKYWQYEVKLSILYIGHTKLIHGHFLSRNEKQPTCRNVACGNL